MGSFNSMLCPIYGSEIKKTRSMDRVFTKELGWLIEGETCSHPENECV